MVKNILTLLLVLGLASTAGAALQISVNGELNPGNDIMIGVDGTAVIGIWTDADIVNNDGFDYLVGVDAGLARFDWSGATFSTTPAINEITRAWPGGALPDPPIGHEGFAGSVFNIGNTVAAGTLLVNNILFQGIAEGNAVITLYNTPDTGPLEIHDSVTIEVVPEPATLALLGLGSLLLRRRRR